MNPKAHGSPSRALVIGLALALSACSHPAQRQGDSPTEEVPVYELVDLTDEFAAVYQASRRLPDDARVASFKAAFDDVYPGFYDSRRMPWLTETEYDLSILSALNEYPEWKDRFESRAVRFASELGPAVESFRDAFPDLEPIGRIYLLYSLKELDGGVRTIRGEEDLIFGIDVMELVHDFEDETPFIHHELFHVYHDQYFEECDQMWCALWSEGMAVAAAHFLNREASDSQLLLTSPRPLRAAVETNLREAVCAIRAVFHSSSEEHYSYLFGASQPTESLPPRFGYYVGYRLVEDALRTQSLDALAKLSVGGAEPLVDRSLANLATCVERPE